MYKRDGNSEIVGFCDSDWGGCLDTRRSTTSYVFLLGGGAISWCSKRQKSPSQSSCEAEYIAAAQAAMEVAWMRSFLGELGAEPTQPIVVGSDSESAINLVLNPVYHERSKHIGLKIHYVREQVLKGEVEFIHIPTEYQVADALTKAVPQDKLEYCRSKMGVRELHFHEAEVEEDLT